MRIPLLLASVIIVVRESVAVPCPIPPPVVTRQEDGTYVRATATARPGLCTLTRESVEEWTKLPEEGGERTLVRSEKSWFEPVKAESAPTR